MQPLFRNAVRIPAVLWALIFATGNGPVHAADDPALFPAAQCAALWFGQDDYAQVSPWLDRDPKDLPLAEAFRAVALRRTTQGPAAIDAFIQAQRLQMGFLVEAFIFGGDRQSRDLHDRLMRDGADFAATQPETRDLR
jgi:hypothetical protein